LASPISGHLSAFGNTVTWSLTVGRSLRCDVDVLLLARFPSKWENPRPSKLSILCLWLVARHILTDWTMLGRCHRTCFGKVMCL
jgi:hypothetical protein